MRWLLRYWQWRGERERAAAEVRLRARFGMTHAHDFEWAFLQSQLFGWRVPENLLRHYVETSQRESGSDESTY